MLALFELQGPRRFLVGAPKSVRGIISLKRTFCGILNNALKRFSLSVSETIQPVSNEETQWPENQAPITDNRDRVYCQLASYSNVQL